MMINASEFSLPWQMTNCEKFALQQILKSISPEVAIEVGTYKGGSLQVLSRYAQKVTSIDIDPGVAGSLENMFTNVNFLSGDSAFLLAESLHSYSNDRKLVQFILIDGDHSAKGVMKDINSILEWKPPCECLVLMHDSFNPECRMGILSSDWQSSSYVHAVEVDYIPGIYHEYAYDTAGAKTMWGGFACAELRAFPRKGPLQVSASQQGLFDAVYGVSSHRQLSRSARVYTRLKRRMQRFLT